MTRRIFRSGFSLLEIISALVILAVVAGAAAATLAPMRGRASQQEMVDEIAHLNSLSEAYEAKHGRLPNNVNDLVRDGFLPISGPGAADRIRRIRRNYQYSPASGTFSQQ